MGAGRPFNLELRDRLLMLIVWYRLQVTNTLVGFLFDLAIATCQGYPTSSHSLASAYRITMRLRTVEEGRGVIPRVQGNPRLH